MEPPLPNYLKIAIVGTPGTGKAALVQEMVTRCGGPQVRVSELCGAHAVAGQFPWFERVAIPVHLHTLYGDPAFKVVQRMMMENCHGFVFVADAHPERIQLAPLALRKFLHHAEALGINFATTPVAMQYHRTELFPGFNPEDMDRFLKISPQQIARFATTSGNCDNAAVAIEWVIRAAVSKLVQPPAQAAG